MKTSKNIYKLGVEPLSTYITVSVGFKMFTKIILYSSQPRKVKITQYLQF